MINRALRAALPGLAALGLNAALAHGGCAPKHGGVVQTATDLSAKAVTVRFTVK